MIILLLVIGLGYILNLLSIVSLADLDFIPYKKLRLLTSLSMIIPYLTLVIRIIYLVCNVYEEFEEILKKKKDKFKLLGGTNKDADLITGDLREKGLKILNLNELERGKQNE